MPLAYHRGATRDYPLSDAAVIVGEPFDVVLAEVLARLDLDEDHVTRSLVCDPVGGATGDIDGLPRLELNLPARRGSRSPPLNEVPVLGPAAVALEAQPLPRIDADPFHLVVGLVGQDRVVPPGTVIRFHIVLLEKIVASGQGVCLPIADSRQKLMASRRGDGARRPLPARRLTEAVFLYSNSK